MTEATLFNWLLAGWMILAILVFIFLFFLPAPYGRYHRKGWGLSLGNKKGWIIMESPASLVFALCFLLGRPSLILTPMVFFIMWETHYVHRAFIYPFSLRGIGKTMPAVVVAMGFFFNCANTYFNGRYIFTLSDGYPNSWLWDPRFLVGVLLFIVGYVLNRQADRKLRALRAPGESGYKIPSAGMFRFVSCPNYLGEMMIWVGWAMATWALPGLAFALWTTANLVPRARMHHTWYKETFPQYPRDRKALIPWLW
jgi:protein-S-isoprenylcysteine O-methyltransferase Ste14